MFLLNSFMSWIGGKKLLRDAVLCRFPLDFDYVRLALRQKHTTDVQRAARFYQIIRQSYASGLTSFASQPHDLWDDFPLIKRASRRLKDVVVENQDFEKLIGHYDRPSAFFYCDPPYHATEGTTKM